MNSPRLLFIAYIPFVQVRDPLCEGIYREEKYYTGNSPWQGPQTRELAMRHGHERITVSTISHPLSQVPSCDGIGDPIHIDAPTVSICRWNTG